MEWTTRHLQWISSVSRKTFIMYFNLTAPCLSHKNEFKFATFLGGWVGGWVDGWMDGWEG